MTSSTPAPALESRSESEGEELPRAFGRYVLFDRIGRGGMADIYLARARTGLGGVRRVVIKRILPRFARDPDFSRLLVEEAKLAARLSHANVVQVFDLGREGEALYIAMEYVEGFDLNQLLRRLSKAQVPLPAEFALFIVGEVLRALDYAHRARDDEGRPLSIVHRDVSPPNVLISFEGEVKLCDFGIARALGTREEDRHEESAIQRARVAGKSAYMAPEHARGEEIDARADIFAAGILLWELCAGRRLYKGTEDQMLEQARRADVPELPDRGLPAQDRLQQVVARALAPSTDARYASAAQMREDLQNYAAEAGLVASPLKMGAFLTEYFGEDIVEVRRARERAAAAWEQEPEVDMSSEQEQKDDSSESSERGGASASPGQARSGPPAEQYGGYGWLVGLVLGAFAVAGLIVYFGLT